MEDRYLPIIYVRGYAGNQGLVESTVDLPYYGFNLGSTKIRTGADGDPEFRIFESPLVRLIRDHGYTDYFARVRDGEVDILRGEPDDDVPRRSIWIYRYYDQTSREIGDGRRDPIEELAVDLGRLIEYVIRRSGAPRVHLVAHSMGGLVCRSLIQRTLRNRAEERVDRLFTYGTPHGGIHFRTGLGFATTLRDLFGINDADTFGPRRMREYLRLPDDWGDDRLHEISHFPPAKVFSLIGTNHQDYNMARLAVGPRSDGLVKMEHAYVRNSSRAFVFRAHSGPLGMVNSDEAYQNLQRFLFGDTSVEIAVENLLLDDALRDNGELRHLLIETQVVIRGEEVTMTDQREEDGSAIRSTPSALENGRETLFRVFLMRGFRPQAREKYSFFQVRLRILPVFVRERRVVRDRHFSGEHLFSDSLTIGIRDQDGGEGRLIRAGWGSLESDAPRQGQRYTDDVIRIPMDGRHLRSGEVTLTVRKES